MNRILSHELMQADSKKLLRRAEIGLRKDLSIRNTSQLQDVGRLPYSFNKNEHHSSPIIGVCLYRGNEESVDDLLKCADRAMYQATDSGRNTVCFLTC
ncbi:MAG: diguanylate cyclase [Gallionellaceae bacterium]